MYEAAVADTGSNVAIKWVRDGRSAFDSEVSHLQQLAIQFDRRQGELPELPVIQRLVDCDSGFKIIVTTPVCRPRKHFNTLITKQGIRQLVNFVDLCATPVDGKSGFVCYDLRHENIMFTDAGELCVIDFADAFAITSVTKSLIVGTTRYAGEDVLDAFKKQAWRISQNLHTYQAESQSTCQ